MIARIALLVFSCVVAGCVTPPAESPPSRQPAPPPSAPSSPTDALEARHRELAQAYTRGRNWADALVQWELLALVNPESREYRDAVSETRKRIRETAAGLESAAEQARRQGNLDLATLLYLRLLNVDRDNTAAAQALRDIDAERTRRSYINRPPRVVM